MSLAIVGAEDIRRGYGLALLGGYAVPRVGPTFAIAAVTAASAVAVARSAGPRGGGAGSRGGWSCRAETRISCPGPAR